VSIFTIKNARYCFKLFYDRCYPHSFNVLRSVISHFNVNVTLSVRVIGNNTTEKSLHTNSRYYFLEIINFLYLKSSQVKHNIGILMKIYGFRNTYPKTEDQC